MATLTRRGAETRSRIVAAAAQLMFDRGIAGTTMEDVREAAEASSSQIYHYFADKQELVRAVIEHHTQTILDDQSTPLRQLDTIAGLRAWGQSIVDHQIRLDYGGCPLGSLAAEVAASDAQARMDLAKGFLKWEVEIRGGLQRMHDRGDLDGDPEALARGLLAALQGGILLTLVQRSTAPLEAALDAAISHIASQTRQT